MAARQIVLDTETTGLNAKLGDRVIEIGCVEMRNRRITERHFHCYLNPERDIEEGAASGPHSSAFSPGFFAAVRQPRRFQSPIHCEMPF